MSLIALRRTRRARPYCPPPADRNSDLDMNNSGFGYSAGVQTGNTYFVVFPDWTPMVDWPLRINGRVDLLCDYPPSVNYQICTLAS